MARKDEAPSSARAGGSRPSGARRLRRLIACPACRRQYDAGGAARGDKLRCLCGELLEIAELRAAEVPVIRCAACGAPRDAGAARCGYCRAPFAVAERDRNTICPQCAARIADAARFCSSCGVVIDPQPVAGAATSAPCPACVPRRELRSRPFAEPSSSVLECDACGGLWLSRELWSTLERRARREASPAGSPRPIAATVAGAVVYRDCPICAAKMHRRNYGGRSGVLLDQCGPHGLWFDADELGRALAWIREGGEELAEQLRREEEVARQRDRRLYPPPPAETPESEADPWRWPADALDLAAILARLFRRGLRRD